jgi:hypothetical protein
MSLYLIGLCLLINRVIPMAFDLNYELVGKACLLRLATPSSAWIMIPVDVVP